MPRLTFSIPVMTPVYRATLAVFLFCAILLAQYILYIFVPMRILDFDLHYYLSIVPMGVAWSLGIQSDWAIGIAIILGIYIFCIAMVELAFSRRGKIAWRSCAFLIVYVAAIPLMNKFYGHII